MPAVLMANEEVAKWIAISSLFSSQDSEARKETEKVKRLCISAYKFDHFKYNSFYVDKINVLKSKLEPLRWVNGKVDNLSMRINLRKISYKIDQIITNILKTHCMIRSDIDLSLIVSELRSDLSNISGELKLQKWDIISKVNNIQVNPINYSHTLRAIKTNPLTIEYTRNGTSQTSSFSCPLDKDCILGFRYGFTAHQDMFMLEESLDKQTHMLWKVKILLDELSQ